MGTSSGLSRLAIAGAAVAGFIAGLGIDIVWPNVVYGIQLIAGLGAVVLMLLAIPLWRSHRQVARGAIAGGAGLLLGIAVGLGQRPATVHEATVDVALAQPAVATLHSTTGECRVVDDRLVLLQAPDGVSLVDGRSVSVSLLRSDENGVLTPEAELRVDVRVGWALDDGSPTDTFMGSDATSTVTVTGTAREGTVTFSDLVVRPESEQREPIDVVGSISWSCAAP